MKIAPDNLRHAGAMVWVVAIVLLATGAGLLGWRSAPGLELYVRDALMRARGAYPPPTDIVIVAIDEKSIARLGRFPWPRVTMARALDNLTAAQPQAVALDILYSEPATKADDDALAAAIKRNGKTIVAAQLVAALDDQGARAVVWLRPLPEIEQAAAAVGHINVSTEADGVARELPLRKADNEGQARWALAVETVRVGEGLRANTISDAPGAVSIGGRLIPILGPGRADAGSLRADRMLLDFTGPNGSFAPQTHSFCEVLAGSVPPEVFRGKYVLIGATAATLGDHIASPFVHSEGADGEQNGELMPGVEVLANALNTILRARYYRETPVWGAAALAALTALATLGLLSAAQGRYEPVKQLAALSGLAAMLLLLSYLAYTQWLLIPPLVPLFVSLATAAPLGLLHRSLATSAQLDARIAELSDAGGWLAADSTPRREARATNSQAALIARLAEADAVTIFARDSRGNYRPAAVYGLAAQTSLRAADLAAATPVRPALFGENVAPADGATNPAQCTMTFPLGDLAQPAGALVITRARFAGPEEVWLLCRELAAGYLAQADHDGLTPPPEQVVARWRWPRGSAGKARAVGGLQRWLLGRARFAERAARSVEDGLLVAGANGQITFANPRAAEILATPERALRGADLFGILAADGTQQQPWLRDSLTRLLVQRAPVEREIALGNAPARHYTLRLSAVFADEDKTGPVLGLVASLSDITQQKELQQTKTDVMTLVSHELRTPLTAIQAMSEVLAQYDVEEPRRSEMHRAINDEAKRLGRMISEYLDLMRLESRARAPQLAPVRLTSLLERVLLLLEPLAANSGITIARRFAPDLPLLWTDADLLTQAVTNLVANAVKYSPGGTEIVVNANAVNEKWVNIWVKDCGYGIPAASLPHIFEKFYRVPRVREDTAGSGLGLAFVREIAESLGGQVTAESRESVGSTFTLHLPVGSRE